MKKIYDMHFSGYCNEFAFRPEFVIDSPSARFKDGGFLGMGGGMPSAEPYNPQTKFTKWADKNILPMLKRAMKGEGLGPEGFSSDRLKAQYEGLESAYETASDELGSNLNRTVHPEDVRVRNFATNQLGRAYIGAKDSIRLGERKALVEDEGLATKMAMDTTAQANMIGLNTAGMYNQTQAQASEIDRRYGTFGTNLAYGAASGLADMYFAKQMAG
jgi:hypothetical protein